VTGRVALAVNPTAGKGRSVAAGALVADGLTAAGVEVAMLAGGSASELAAAARAAVAAGVDALVVVGGDGTVHLGTGVVSGTGTPLGIVAVGTGNDIARELGLVVGEPTRAAHDVVAALAAGSVRAVDAVRCTSGTGRADGAAGADTEHWFAGVLAAGFDALVNERANGWSRPRGHLRYDLAILRELPVLRPRQYLIDLDGERWETEAVMAVVANATSYGGGMRVCPGALMDDGLLDVLVVLPLSRTAFVRIYPRVYKGTHVDDPRVVVRRARRVEIASEGIVAYADGERMAPLPLTCEAVPGALRVLVPPAGRDTVDGTVDNATG
jgi:diacylglycerol kinase (ATP)